MTGYALGACLVSLLVRVGGAIFSKSADISSDLVGRVQELDEDAAKNPGTIVDNVGDIVG